MAMPPQANEAILVYTAPTKMQRAPCSTYPIPLPSPDSYTGKTWEDVINNIKNKNGQPEDRETIVKLYNSDEDSYSSQCPKDKKYSCKRPPTIWLERKFLQFFKGDTRGVPCGAMLEIQEDLKEEYNVLICARITAAQRRKAKEGQHCFVQQDLKHCDKLEYLIWQRQTQARDKQDKRMILMTVLALSQEH